MQNSNQKGIASIIYIIIIVALLAIVGFFAYQYFSKPQTPNSNSQANSNVQNSSSSSSVSSIKSSQNSVTAGWRTYTNSQYGFEIKYPQDWKVDLYNSELYTLYLSFVPDVQPSEANDYRNIGKSFRLYIRDISLNGFISELNNPEREIATVCNPIVQKIEDLNINSLNAKKITSCWVSTAISTGNTDINIFIERNGLAYIFDNINTIDTTNVQTFNKAVSTFKFTK